MTVSNRFRQVALTTPTIWSVVHNAQTPDELEAFLTRSGEGMLTVCINEHFGDSKYLPPKLSVREFMRTVMKPDYRRRWHEFKFTMEDAGDFEVMKNLGDGELLDFPVLKSMFYNRPAEQSGAPTAEFCRL